MYFVSWFLAGVVCIGWGAKRSARHRFPVGRAVAVLFCCALLIFLGSRLLYSLESASFPTDDYVPAEFRGPLHGFRIPGGVLLLAIGSPIVTWLFGVPFRRFGDVNIPLVALALVFIRFGCFLNGCCFGKLSHLPWAMTFPRGSVAFAYHAAHGWVAPGAPMSLPVHPLQLYLVIAAGVIFLVLQVATRWELAPGQRQLLFYALFFSTTAFLEPFRANYLTLNRWLDSSAAILFSAVAVGAMMRSASTARASPSVGP